ncbi:MAG: hypothetical protein MK135_09835 [Polyangiaceae bacterium]|nr:hypothetical protein [Polyangiaceae bacterium]
MSAAEDLRVDEGLGLSSCAFHLTANDNATPPTSSAARSASRRQGGARLAQLEERARRGGGLLQLYAYVSGAVLKAVDPLGLDKDPLHADFVEAKRNDGAERDQQLESEQTEYKFWETELNELRSTPNAYEGDLKFAESKLREVQSKMEDSAAAWSQRVKQLDEAIYLTADTMFHDGYVSSMRLHGSVDRAAKIAARLESYIKIGPVGTPLLLAHNAVDPPQNREEEAGREDAYRMVNEAVNAAGTIREARVATRNNQFSRSIDGQQLESATMVKAQVVKRTKPMVKGRKEMQQASRKANRSPKGRKKRARARKKRASRGE